MQLSDLTADIIRPHVGTTFTITFSDGRTVDLLLDEVVVMLEKHVSPRMARDSFALYFTGPKDVLLQQGTYPFAHEALGELPMFIGPKKRRENGTYEFEAVFT